jgi:exo-1,4-beta-D-glucosaminidase
MNFLQKTACFLFLTFVFIAGGIGRTTSGYSVILNEGWFVQSSEKTAAKGEEISRPGFSTASWHTAPVPGTVLGALVGNNVYRDIYAGKNFERIPADPFEGSWWYRTEFFVADDPAHNLFRLEFDGINYRANIWLNGKLVAGADKTAGAFRRFDFDVTGLLKPGSKNALAVEVFPPQPGDLTLGFVDWNPKPPDKNMGLWREVRLIRSGIVSLHFPFVKTRVDLDTLKEARLEISTEVRNNTGNRVSGVLEGRVEMLRFSRPVELEPGETKLVLFSPADTPQLVIENPRLWWSHDFGTPELYDLELSFTSGSVILDIQSLRFGIREVSDYFNEAGYRGYKLNGKKILIRGGGWVDELLLDSRYKKIEAEVKYARHMNLNTLRLEGFWGENEDLYDLCDENGILLMAGWSCQWEWENYFGKPTDEYGGIKTPEQIRLAGQSWKDQVKWLRNHPSIFVWLMGSDLLPRPALEKEFIKILSLEDPTRPSLISAGGKVSTLTGKSGVKMNGPYDYVPPDYWYVDTKNGGAFGFNTETGPGPQVPLVESIKKFIPAKDLWPINDVWDYHCARGEFNTLDRYNEAMARRLGAAQNLEEYGLKAQFLNYEGMRAMFEAFAANKFTATGIIQWMYNSAWPKLWWQLYDYYLMPTGAFYGARKACEPVHILYAYGKNGIVLVNSTLSDQHDLRATALVLNSDMTNVFSKEWTVSMAPNEAQTIFTLPDLPELSRTYFLDLRLFDRDGRPLSSNFYCLSTKPDVLDEAKTEWFVTPVKDYADMTALNALPPVRLKTGYRFGKEGPRDVIAVELENPTSSVAFMVELRLVKDKSGEAVLPVFWEDNYFSVLPGEKRALRGSFAAEDLGGEKPVLKISGWNVK